MSEALSKPCTAFFGDRLLRAASLAEVALAVRPLAEAGGTDTVLVFDDATGAVVDLDPRGTAADSGSLRPLPDPVSGDAAEVPDTPRGRGRPKLGVVAREVTLLPRHWDWLASQPGGASVVLRRLVEDARRRDGGKAEARARQAAAYRFLSAMAGDRPGFEEAARALFAGDDDGFARRMAGWPADVRGYALRLAAGGGAGA